MKTALLESLYNEYRISSYKFGAIHDKLGDVYEEYCVRLFNDQRYLEKLKAGVNDNTDTNVLLQLLSINGIDNTDEIQCLSATNDVPHRHTGGMSKTDIIATVSMLSGEEYILPISCKQSTVSKVAVAEFDVDTIFEEIGIDNDRLYELMMKHQTECSAKNFTQSEKAELRSLLAPIRREFVSWVLTGSPTPQPDNILIPTSMIFFELSPPRNRYDINIDAGDFDLLSFRVLTIEDYINKNLFNNGRARTGGFGTGLSWTYATGSAGEKIQFKGYH